MSDVNIYSAQLIMLNILTFVNEIFLFKEVTVQINQILMNG